MARSLPVFLVALVGACAPAAPSTTPATPAPASPAPASSAGAEATAAVTFPVALLTGPGGGPALYTSAAPDAAAVGYVSADVELEVTGPPEGDRVPVRIRGPLEVRAHLALVRLGARIQRRGRIRGTPVYVAGNDRVRVLGFESDGRIRVEAIPVDASSGSPIAGAFVGSYPVAGVGAARVAPSDATVAPGAPHRLPAGVAIPLFDQPGGQVVATLPARDIGLPCLVAREENGFRAVLVGSGPYLAGYVRETPTPSSAPAATTATAPSTGSGVPARLREDGTKPLRRIAAGTRIVFDGRTVARLGADGYAREMQRYPDTDEVDVFVAVDDTLAVRGMVPSAALTPVAP
ncbi:MAG: hypothetical protein U0230_01405 [Polyangiales bacterium]